VAHKSSPDFKAGRFDVSSRSTLIYQNDRTRVFRLAPTAERGSIICKERLGADAQARVRNEARILERLTGIDGVPRFNAALTTPTSIALEDDGGIALAQMLGGERLQRAAVVAMALRLVRIVAEVHRRGVVHKNINPTTILVIEREQKLFLVDFDLATTFAEDRPGFVPHREIAGELPYLAPEQTGRTGRPVDYRADFYAMGATFYELATGHPPFGREDPLQLIHDHLARLPTPPAEVDEQIPSALSDIITRLLEKEPDRRYQSAEGLAHDLARLHQQLARDEVVSFQLGERDFPLRLSPPSRLFGRSAELGHLRTAFDRALHGEARSIFIAGPPGIGKTALIDELRPLATGRRGWFLVGKFDQYRRDTTSGPVVQVLRAIGRMLLAEPEPALAEERVRIIAALGPNAALITALLPEFAVLLGPTAQVASSDPIEAEAQQRLALIDLLRVVAQTRPVVMVLDDLQWAYQNSFRLVDAVLTDDRLAGLLLVCAYRDADLDVAPAFVAMQAKWQRLGVAPPVLRLGNLAATDLAGMLAEMLRLSAIEASRLAATLGARTSGNPFDTVELVNALRRDGLLVPGPDGWNWDEAAIRRYIGHGEVDFLTSRLAALPRVARQLLELMACLGGDVGIGQLQASTGLTIAALEEQLAPAFEDGLLIMDRGTDGSQLPGGAAVRFRHDRIQQTLYCVLKPGRRRALHLSAARRLARDAQYRTAAADQYLSVLESIHDPRERHRVIALFREAAGVARLAANYGAVERFLAAAMTLLDAHDGATDAATRAAIRADLHAALYNLGRHQEADELYATIAGHCRNPLGLAEATCVQVNSLCSRHRLGEAVALGLDLLGRLGVKVPDEAERVEWLNELYRSMSAEDVARHFHRPEVSEPRALAVSKLINRVIAPASFCDPAVMAWLVLESVRLLSEHGPCAALVSNLGLASIATIALADDYRTGYEIARAALLAGEARGYEPETSRLAVTFASFGSHWFEPLENALSLARRAREGLIRAGDLQFASFTYLTSVEALIHCGPTLEAGATEVDAALAFAARTSNEHATAQLLVYRQLVRTLRGETDGPGRFSDGSFDEMAHRGALAANPATGVVFHAHLALAAAIFGDAAKLAEHAAIAVPMLSYIRGLHSSVLVHWLAALDLAWRAAAAPADEQAGLLAELDHHRDFLARRAIDAPENLLHLVHFIDAERAFAAGDGWGAASAFDAALAQSQLHQRPWQQALIAERAGLCLMAQGLNHAGRDALTKSRQGYELWGASAKVQQLEHRHGFLRGSKVAAANTAAHRGSGFSSDAIDLLAVLRASQALSSQTTLEKLQTRIIELLEAMTGATTVLVAFWRDEPPGWYLSTTGNETDMVSVEDAAARGLLPLTAIRYTERTREPLLVNDASRDYRFAADPYMAGLNCCSLLVVPVLSHGAPRALLLLENRLARGAFATDRLEAVTLIAGQLAVSFDNALLYALLERRVADRTQALAQANARLEALSITDPLTGIANRRRFEEVLEAEWKRALRLRSSIGMVLVDVDHFKLYNDRYGHVAGDLCLRRVAEALGSSVRHDVDLVARYGGEEFAMILPGAHRPAVHRVGERARAVVAALEEPHPRAAGGFVTISAGVAATVPSPQSSAEELIECADAALYEAKRAGRNQVRDGDARVSLDDIGV
jgi:diguanylate cyclase (GGDEF)-like protein